MEGRGGKICSSSSNSSSSSISSRCFSDDTRIFRRESADVATEKNAASAAPIQRRLNVVLYIDYVPRVQTEADVGDAADLSPCGGPSSAGAVPPRSSSLTVVDTSSPPLVVPDVVQKVIRVLREPGVALGMSVAGGIGSLPDDAHDEVSCRHQQQRQRYLFAKWRDAWMDKRPSKLAPQTSIRRRLPPAFDTVQSGTEDT